MSFKFTTALALVLGIVTSLNAQTRLDVLTNPGFESPAGAGGAGMQIADWTTTTSVPVASFTNFPPPSNRPPEGRQYAVFGESDSISQSFNPGLAGSRSLTVSLQVRDGQGTFGIPSTQHLRMELNINGTVVRRKNFTDVVGNDRWATRQISYFHPSGSPLVTSMTLTISHVGPALTSGFYRAMLIDDVEVWRSPRYLSRGDFGHFDFEDRPVGAYVDPALPIENWNAAGTVAIAGATGATTMPASGSQWAEISTNGTDPASVIQSNTAFLRIRPESTEIQVDWSAMTNETPGNTQFFDELRLELWNASGTISFPVEIRTVLDTSDNSISWSSTNAISQPSGNPMANELTNRRTEVFIIDESLLGKELVLECRAFNQGDSSVETVLMVDDVRGVAAVRFTGSDEILRMASAVRPNTGTGFLEIRDLSGGPGEDSKRAQPGDEIQISAWSTTAALDFLPYVLIGELVGTGVYPASFPDLGFWMTLANSVVLIDGTKPSLFGPAQVIAPGGVFHSFEAPAGLAGQSALLQYLVPTNSVGQNGFFVSSDTHEIVF